MNTVARVMIRSLGAALVVWFIYTGTLHLTHQGIVSGLIMMASHWWFVLLFLAAYSLAFYTRSIGWGILLQGYSPGAGVLCRYHLAGLSVNHLLPMKAGDALRIYLLQQNHQSGWKHAISSVVFSRLLDLSSLVLIASAALLMADIPNSNSYWIGIAVFSAPFLMIWGFSRYAKGAVPFMAFLQAWFWIGLSWILEGVVVWSVIQSMDFHVSFPLAAGINAVTIAGQIFHVTPGGLGTYESVMSFLLQQVGFPLAVALEIALLSHLLKFIYSYTVGGWALVSTGINRNDLIMLFKRKGGVSTDEKGVNV